ncbi:MAG: nitrate reductase subunit beta [Actinomycetes bacterium]
MNIRAQVSMVFHLDKCIGCHTCSIACKNVWTDRKGTEYMWWNNVETKPGTGYPTRWEDQEAYRGGWERNGKGLKLKLQGRGRTLVNLFANPNQPSMDEYYEPWTYRYGDLLDAPAGDDQPTARPVSLVTGDPIDIEAGPNWDDDLSGSDLYAANDPNLDVLTAEERADLKEIERLVFFYLPRICNHCVNPSCVAACPTGAIYKRGEDGIVVLSQEKCRAWRMCISGCPYKKTFFNWETGKSEKCVLCYPRVETGQAPACFHSCVGRIRYMGLILYDADKIVPAAMVDDENLVDAHRDMICDPRDPEVIAAAKENGITDDQIKAAQNSPVYKFVKEWGLALPLHPEFRTLPMLFYVPPMLPVLSAMSKEGYDVEGTGSAGPMPQFTTQERARVPIKFMASLFSAGNEDVIAEVYRKLFAVRVHMRSTKVGDVPADQHDTAMRLGNMDAEQAEAIFRLTALPTSDERFVLPPGTREVSMEELVDPYTRKQDAGFGFRQPPERRW